MLLIRRGFKMRIDENRERIERVEASELGGVRESETKKVNLTSKKSNEKCC